MVNDHTTGAIDQGLLILLGVHKDDTEADSDFLVDKTATLRIFNDDAGKMNRSVRDVEGSALVVSQFTLVGDWRKGRRPSFTAAATPDDSKRLYRHFMAGLRTCGIAVASGEFGAMMQVELVNDGPVTFVLDSKIPPRRGKVRQKN